MKKNEIMIYKDAMTLSAVESSSNVGIVYSSSYWFIFFCHIQLKQNKSKLYFSTVEEAISFEIKGCIC